MTAPSGRARIRISADVDPELAAAIDRTMRRAADSVDRRMRGMADSSERAGGRMGAAFDAAYRRMEQSAARVNSARASEEGAVRRIEQAQQRAAAAAQRGSQINEDAARRNSAHSARQAAAQDDLTRATQRQGEAQRRVAESAGRSASEQQQAQANLSRATRDREVATRRLAETEAAAERARQQAARASASADAARRRALEEITAATQAAADAGERRRQAEEDFEQRRREVVDIDARLNENDALRAMVLLRARLQAMANRPITQDIRVAVSGLATLLKAAAGVLGLVTALGTLGLAAGAVVIPIAAISAALATLITAAAQASLALPGIFAGLLTIVGTVVIGFKGISDAMKDTAAGAEAMAGLSVAGQEVVRTLKSLKPEIITFRNEVQSALLDGVGPGLSGMVNAIMPVLTAGFVQIAAALNTGIVATLQQLSSDEAAGALSGLLNNSALSAQHLADAMAPAVQGLLNLVSIGSEYLPGLTGGMEGAATSFLDWTRDADKVRATIERGLDILQQFGGVLSNLGGIVSGVFNAANEGGGGLLNTLTTITGTLDDWVNSVEGQEALTSFSAPCVPRWILSCRY